MIAVIIVLPLVAARPVVLIAVIIPAIGPTVSIPAATIPHLRRAASTTSGTGLSLRGVRGDKQRRQCA
jgi:hypothetical protein